MFLATNPPSALSSATNSTRASKFGAEKQSLTCLSFPICLIVQKRGGEQINYNRVQGQGLSLKKLLERLNINWFGDNSCPTVSAGPSYSKATNIPKFLEKESSYLVTINFQKKQLRKVQFTSVGTRADKYLMVPALTHVPYPNPTPFKDNSCLGGS